MFSQFQAMIKKELALYVFQLLKKNLYLALVLSFLPLPVFIWAYFSHQTNALGNSIGNLIGSLTMTFGALTFYFLTSALVCLPLSYFLVRLSEKLQKNSRVFVTNLVVESLVMWGAFSLPLITVIDSPYKVFLPITVIANIIIALWQGSKKEVFYDSQHIRSRWMVVGPLVLIGTIGYISLFTLNLRLKVAYAYQFVIGTIF